MLDWVKTYASRLANWARILLIFLRASMTFLFLRKHLALPAERCVIDQTV